MIWNHKSETMNLEYIFSEAQKVYDEFDREEWGRQCYGWRGERVERMIAKSTPGLAYVGNKDNPPGDFLHTDGTLYESKCVKNAFKITKRGIRIPPITIKNFRRNQYETTFDNKKMIVWDIERKGVAMFTAETVQKHSKQCDSNVTTELPFDEAIESVLLNEQLPFLL